MRKNRARPKRAREVRQCKICNLPRKLRDFVCNKCRKSK